jgi:hypothetical protein
MNLENLAAGVNAAQTTSYGPELEKARGLRLDELPSRKGF